MAGEPPLEEQLGQLVWWCRELEAVRKAKLAGLPKPWSTH